MNIIYIPFKGTKEEARPAFDHVSPELLEFNPGQRVLSAYDFNNPNETSIYFVKKHDPGDPYFPEGGYECRDISGGFRAYYLDALIIHPSQVKTSQYQTKNKGRGRPKKYTMNIDGSDIVEKVKSGVRGRPRKYAEGESPSALAKVEQNSKPKGSRGRPRLNPDELVQKKEYIPTGGQRGRKRMYEPGMSPSALAKKAQENKPKDPNGAKRGRPRKVIE